MKSIISFVTFVILFLHCVWLHAAGMDSQLNGIFSGMTNTTPPGMYETQRRGVISGGRATYKTRIMNENLINVQVPTASGSCSGIDMFGGSLSFISADQLVQVFRSVASNAAGYAFQMAMKNMCSQCAEAMENFQNKMQKLNQMMANSCQLAQGLVTNVVGGAEQKRESDENMLNTVKGTVSDVFDGKWSGVNDSPAKTAKTHNPDEAAELAGNVVWKGLQKGNIKAWFVGAGAGTADDEVLETMMSFSGSLIVGEANDSGDKEERQFAYLPPILTVKQFLEGNEGNNQKITIYDCPDSTDCLNPGTKDVTYTGLYQRILKLLIGDASTPGIIDKMQDPTYSGTATAQEEQFLANLPGDAHVLLRKLSPVGAASGSMAVDIAKAVSVSMASHHILNIMRAVRSSLPADHPDINTIKEQLDGAEKSVYEQIKVLQNDYGRVQDLLTQYELRKNLIEKTRLNSNIN